MIEINENSSLRGIIFFKKINIKSCYEMVVIARSCEARSKAISRYGNKDCFTLNEVRNDDYKKNVNGRNEAIIPQAKQRLLRKLRNLAMTTSNKIFLKQTVEFGIYFIYDGA